MRQVAIVTLICLALGGCVFYTTTWVPKISGVLMDRGKPVEGAELWVVDNSKNNTKTVTKTMMTDAEGRFSTEPITESYFGIPMVGDRAPQSYGLEVRYTGKRYAINNFETTLRRGGDYKELSLLCDIPARPAVYAKDEVDSELVGALKLSCREQ